MAKGIRAVKDSKSITSNTPDDYLYSSEFASPKIYKRFEATVTANANGDATLIITHDLGYNPIFLVYMNPTVSIVNGPVFGVYRMLDSWGIINNDLTFCYSTPYTIRIDIQSNSSFAGVKYNFVGYIFAEPS